MEADKEGLKDLYEGRLANLTEELAVAHDKVTHDIHTHTHAHTHTHTQVLSCTQMYMDIDRQACSQVGRQSDKQ